MATRKPFPSEMQERIIVRLPDGMRDRLAELAKSNNRSVNAEVVSCLEALLKGEAVNATKAERDDLSVAQREGYLRVVRACTAPPR